MTTMLTAGDWAYIFTLPMETVWDTKIIAMQYKMLHRAYATNSIIPKLDSTKKMKHAPLANKKQTLFTTFSTPQTYRLSGHNLNRMLLTTAFNVQMVCHQKILFLASFNRSSVTY